ncbi:MAG: hypothetical protein ABI295_04530 [Xanthomarina sp.]
MKKVYLIISIDTECDKDSKWEIPQPMRFDNIFEQQIMLFPLFKKYRIKPTYLLSPEVLKDENSVNFFQENIGWIELGTHLHVEFIAPNENMTSTNTNDIQRNCKKEVEFEKLKNLTNLFEAKFGFQPTSFRSGRFGSSDYTTSILSELGYKVDSSIVPFTTKVFKNHRIDSWGKSVIPYWETFKDKRLLQVPLTLMNSGYDKLPAILKRGIGKPNSLTKKITAKLGFSLKTEWLRPYRKDTKELIEIADYVINNSFKKSDFAILNIMFHSNEILPAASPYCKTPLEVESFIKSLDELFNYICQNHELCAIGLSDLHEVYNQS